MKPEEVKQLTDKTSERINQADKEDEFVKEIDLILYEESEDYR